MPDGSQRLVASADTTALIEEARNGFLRDTGSPPWWLVDDLADALEASEAAREEERSAHARQEEKSMALWEAAHDKWLNLREGVQAAMANMFAEAHSRENYAREEFGCIPDHALVAIAPITNYAERLRSLLGDSQKDSSGKENGGESAC